MADIKLAEEDAEKINVIFQTATMLESRCFTFGHSFKGSAYLRKATWRDYLRLLCRFKFRAILLLRRSQTMIGRISPDDYGKVNPIIGVAIDEKTLDLRIGGLPDAPDS